jgi:hypothetical protein
MNLGFLMVAAIVGCSPVYAHQTEPSPSGTTESSTEDGPGTLPGSPERIRKALALTPDAPLGRWVNERPDFSTGVEERLTFEELFEARDYSKEPVPAGGLYAFEQQRLLNPPNHRPAAQPWGAFTSGELAQVAATSTLAALLSRYLAQGFQNVFRSEDQEAAQREVERAIVDYCANRPGGGHTIVICETRD